MSSDAKDRCENVFFENVFQIFRKTFKDMIIFTKIILIIMLRNKNDNLKKIDGEGERKIIYIGA